MFTISGVVRNKPFQFKFLAFLFVHDGKTSNALFLPEARGI